MVTQKCLICRLEAAENQLQILRFKASAEYSVDEGAESDIITNMKYLQIIDALKESRNANKCLAAELETYNTLVTENAPSSAFAAATRAERMANICTEVTDLLHVKSMNFSVIDITSQEIVYD